MPISNATNVLSSLESRHGISKEMVLKIYALGWGSEFEELSYFGHVSQIILDDAFGSEFPNADPSFYNFVFWVLRLPHAIPSLISTKENGLTMLDMLIIPQKSEDYVNMNKVARWLRQYLTPREYKYFCLRLCEHLPIAEIAKQLSVKPESARDAIGCLRHKIRLLPCFSELDHRVFTQEYFNYRADLAKGKYLKPLTKAHLQLLFPTSE